LNGRAGEHIAEIQRARLIAGAVRAVDELGYTRATVTDVTRGARVSRRTFYEQFSSLEDCLAAVLDNTVERVVGELAHADLAGLSWRERVRGGLCLILSFLDREPVLARVCVVESARGGQRVLEHRERIAKQLVRIVEDGREQGTRAQDPPPLTAEGLVGAAVSIVHARLVRGEREPLTGLLGELMYMIVLPYLGPSVARRERARSLPAAGVLQGARAEVEAANGHGDPLAGIPMRLTYRTVRVLEAVAEHPGFSNRMVRESADIADEGQCSKLLARLERFGLLANTGAGHTKGEPNSWRLTSKGLQVTQTIRAHAGETGAIV
jgi:AcrR family transcriptional regulator